MNQTHELFKQNLKGSLPSVAAVAGYFIKNGKFDVNVEALHVPETIAQGITDQGDMRVRRKGEEDWHPIEVKSYSYSFESLRHFPHIIMDKKTGFENKGKPAKLYFAVPSCLKYALIFNYDKYHEHLYLAPFKDQVTGKICDCYVADNEWWQEVEL